MMITKRQIKSLDAKLQAQMVRIAKDRDSLDALIDDYRSLKEDCDEAWQCLQDARDALSRLV